MKDGAVASKIQGYEAGLNLGVLASSFRKLSSNKQVENLRENVLASSFCTGSTCNSDYREPLRIRGCQQGRFWSLCLAERALKDLDWSPEGAIAYRQLYRELPMHVEFVSRAMRDDILDKNDALAVLDEMELEARKALGLEWGKSVYKPTHVNWIQVITCCLFSPVSLICRVHPLQVGSGFHPRPSALLLA